MTSDREQGGMSSENSEDRSERIIRRLRGATSRRPEGTDAEVESEWFCRSCGAPVEPGQGICGSTIEQPNFVVYDNDVGEDGYASYQPVVCKTTIGERVIEYTASQLWELRRWKLGQLADRRKLPHDLADAARRAARGKSRRRVKMFLTACAEVLRHMALNQPPEEPSRRDEKASHPLLVAARSRKALPRVKPWSDEALARLAKGK